MITGNPFYWFYNGSEITEFVLQQKPILKSIKILKTIGYEDNKNKSGYMNI